MPLEQARRKVLILGLGSGFHTKRKRVRKTHYETDKQGREPNHEGENPERALYSLTRFGGQRIARFSCL